MTEKYTIKWTLKDDPKCEVHTSLNTFTLQKATELCSHADKYFTQAKHYVTLIPKEKTNGTIF